MQVTKILKGNAMRHGMKHRKLNMDTNARRALFSNLTNAVLTHEQIKVTLPRAKELRTFVDNMITLGKKGGLANRRLIIARLNDIETAIDLAPGNVLYYLEKGMLCYRVKFTEEGIRTMQKACEIAPEVADVYYLLGRLYMQQGDKEKAKPALESAVELGHPDARAQLDDLK